MATASELLHKETKLLSNMEFQRDLYKSLLDETDESKKSLTIALIEKLQAEEKAIRAVPAG